MPSETIWSSASSSSSPPFRSVLDLVDPSVAKYFNNGGNVITPDTLPQSLSVNDGGRRFSFNDGSDIDHTLFGLKKGSLLAIAPGQAGPGGAPTGPGGSSGAAGGGSATAGAGRINFGAASISAGITSRHPHPDSFLRKFASVADATRDIELAQGLSKVSIDPQQERRTSFSRPTAPSQPLADVLSSPHGSLNEPLNVPVSRSSRHQLISEKIDNYNNNSPIQAHASLSTKSDSSPQQISAQMGEQFLPSGGASGNGAGSVAAAAAAAAGGGGNFWNPATATSFIPGGPGGPTPLVILWINLDIEMAQQCLRRHLWFQLLHLNSLIQVFMN